jgi:hypothetical protein
MQSAYTRKENFNIIFIPNVHISDCKQIDQLFAEQLLSVDVPAIKQRYDKIPSTFISLDTWPKSNNLDCWNCSRQFETIPIFVPKTIEPFGGVNDIRMSVLGNFCHWGCATAWVTIRMTGEELKNTMDMLKYEYEIFTGKKAYNFQCSPDVYDQPRFGGELSPTSWYKKMISGDKYYKKLLRTNKTI